MPILSNVLVTATKTSVQVTAFDLDVGVVSEHFAEVTKQGSITALGQDPLRHCPERPGAAAHHPQAAQPLRGDSERHRPFQDRRDVARRVPEAAPRGRRAFCDGERGSAAGDDSQDVLRHLERRDALHPQRRLLRTAPDREGTDGGHRRSSPGDGGTSEPGRLQAQRWRHHPAQGPARAQAAAGRGAGRGMPAGLRGELSALQEEGPDHGDAPHRWPVPRVPARDPQGRRPQGAAQPGALSRSAAANRPSCRSTSRTR